MPRTKDYGYQWEKLDSARRALMLPHPQGEAPAIAGAFFACSLAFRDFEQESVRDPDARRWIATIVEAMDTTGLEDPSGVGTYAVKAALMTEDEQSEFSRAVDQLAFWFRETVRDLRVRR